MKTRTALPNWSCLRNTTKLLAVSCIAFCGNMASAGTIYSNLGDGLRGYVGYEMNSTSSAFLGTAFTTTGAGVLSDIVIHGLAFTAATPVTLGLYTDNTNEPGTLLESWTTTTLPTGDPSPLTILPSVINPSLSASTQYWVVVSRPSGTIVLWSNDQGVNGGVWAGNSLTNLFHSSIGNPTPGIQLDSVPEPASATLLCLGFGALLLTKRAMLWRA
jgi:hypothetical protein